MKISLFLVPLLFLTFSVKAQLHTDSLTLDLIRHIDDSRGKETGAVIILKDYVRTIDAEGNDILVLRNIGKVFNKEAVLDYSQIPLSYNSYYEEPVLNYARVIRKDGTVKVVSKDAIQIKTVPYEGSNYSDQRYLSFALPALEPGAVFDYQVTFIRIKQEIEGEIFENHWFSGLLQRLSPPYTPRIDPVMTSRYVISVPAGKKIQYDLTFKNVLPDKQFKNDQDIYTWNLTDLPSVSIEDRMPSLIDLNPVLIISTLKNWSELDTWANEKILSKADVSKEIREKTFELIKEKKSDIAKIKAISEFIQNNIQYISADINRGGYVPHDPVEVLNSGYGDCKDQTILLISMLASAGITSYPALINPYPYPEFTRIPVPMFTHLITYIPGYQKEIWLDMTSGVTPSAKLYFANQGRTAFVINGEGGKLLKTPVSVATENIANFDFQLQIKEGRSTLKMIISAEGMQNDMLKSILSDANEEDRNQFFRELVPSYLRDFNLDTIKISDINNPEANLNVTVVLHSDSAWQKSQEPLIFGSHAFVSLDFLGNIDVKDLPVKRHNDIVEYFPYTLKGTERYSPPLKEYLPVIIPENEYFQNELISYGRTFTLDGNTTIVNWFLTINQITIPKEKYEWYLGCLKNIEENFSWKIDYVDPGPYISDLLRNEKQEDILKFCSTLLEENPKNPLALLLRGIINQRNKEDDKALEDLATVLKSYPENKYAHLWIFYPLIHKKDISLAISHMNMAIRLDPQFQDAYIRRGLFYADCADFNLALLDLDQALKLDSANAFCLNVMADIFHRKGNNKEALSALHKALRIDPKNSGVYSALGKIYLDMDMYRESLEMFLKAVELEPDYINYAYLGLTFYLTNDDNKCIEYSQKATALNPSGYFAKFNIALATLRSGNITEARKLYEELKKQSASIPESEWKGAVIQLNALMEKSVYVKEIKQILLEYFGVII